MLCYISECAAGWVKFENVSCYRTVAVIGVGAKIARQHCLEIGSDLAIIQSKKATEFILEKLFQNKASLLWKL